MSTFVLSFVQATGVFAKGRMFDKPALNDFPTLSHKKSLLETYIQLSLALGPFASLSRKIFQEEM